MREEWRKWSDLEQVGMIVVSIGTLLVFFVPSLTGRVTGPGRYPEMVSQAAVVVMTVFGVIGFALRRPPRWFRYVPLLVLTVWFVGSRLVSLWAFNVSFADSPAKLAFEAGLWVLWAWVFWRWQRRLRRQDVPGGESEAG